MVRLGPVAGHDVSAQWQNLFNGFSAHAFKVKNIVVALSDGNFSGTAVAHPGDEHPGQRRPGMVLLNPGPKSGIHDLPWPGNPSLVSDACRIEFSQQGLTAPTKKYDFHYAEVCVTPAAAVMTRARAMSKLKHKYKSPLPHFAARVRVKKMADRKRVRLETAGQH